MCSEMLVPTYESARYNDLDAGTIKAIAIYATAWGPTLHEGKNMLLAFHIFCQVHIVHKFKHYSKCIVSSRLHVATTRKFISALGLKIAVTLRSGRSGFRIPVWIRDFFFSPKGPELLWGHTAFYSMGIAVISSR